MRKGIAVILIFLTLMTCISFGVLANNATSTFSSSKTGTTTQNVSKQPMIMNQYQDSAKYNDQKTNNTLNTTSNHPSSKLDNFKKFFHDKIAMRIKLGWQHFKGLKIWHRNTNNTVKK